MFEFGKGIFGQQDALKSLYNIYTSKRIPHAFLFSGNEGIGKYFAANHFVQLLNSASENSQIFPKIQKLQEPFIKLIFPLPRGKNETGDEGPLDKFDDEMLAEVHSEISKKAENPYHQIQVTKATSIKISSIREIKKFLSLNYSDLIYRVIIILDAHLMNEEAQNSLLKSLEEPPEGTVFIIITHKKDYLLPTIISRCSELRFAPLSKDNVSTILVEYFDFNKKDADILSNFADGSVAKALKLAKYEIKSLEDNIINIISHSAFNKIDSAKDFLESFKTIYGDDAFDLVLDLVNKFLIDSLRLRVNNNASIYFENRKERVQKFNSFMKDAPIESVINNLEKLRSNLRYNINLNLFLLNIILELNVLNNRL